MQVTPLTRESEFESEKSECARSLNKMPMHRHRRRLTTGHRRSSSSAVGMTMTTMFVSIFLSIILTSISFDTVSAVGILNSHQLVAGDWDLKFRGLARGMDVSQFFPPTGPHRTDRPPSKSRRRFLECILAIKPDGTFEILPKEGTCDLYPSLQKDGGSSSTDSTATNENVMPLRGTWSLYSNPYCITDRFYDTLVLKTYPRNLKRIAFVGDDDEEEYSGTSDKDRNEEKNFGENIETIHFELHCRLWCSTRSSRGKLTHGSLVRIQEEPDDIVSSACSSNNRRSWGILKRPILASFSANRQKVQPRLSQYPGEDFAYFGY